MLDLTQVKQFKQYRNTINNKPISDYFYLLESILSCKDDEIKNLELEWELTEQENREISQHNSKLKIELTKQIESFCKSLGLGTYKRNNSGKITGTHTEFKALLKQLDIKCRTSYSNKPSYMEIKVGDEKFRYHTSPCKITEVVNYARQKLEQKQKDLINKNKELALAISLAGKYNISIEDPDLIDKVTELERQEFIKNNYPNGTELSIDCCSECSSWTVGEHRCSCGNRRIYLEVDGSINNFYANPCAN